MSFFDINNGEKLAYICLMISPALIGITAVFLSFSPDTGVNQKMLLAMFLCFAISFYFTIQYKIYDNEKKKNEAFSMDLQKELSTRSATNKIKNK